METIISGIVIEVLKSENALETTIDKVTFKVKWIEGSNVLKNVYMTCYTPCPIRKSDCIYAKCLKCGKLNNERLEHYDIIKPPMVVINKEKETMINNIMIYEKVKYPGALQIYNTLLSDVMEEHELYDHITSNAENWHRYHREELSSLFDEFDIKGFLDYWYREYNLRELKLLGLTYDNVETYNKPCKYIFEQCIKNPYVIYNLSIEQCDDIIERLNMIPNPEQREQGLIVRHLYNNTVSKQWFCCPSYSLSKQFPMIKKHVDILKKEYDVVVDLQSVYLKKYYNIECKVAKFIIDMVNNDSVISHLDPINEVYIGKNGQEFIRYKALENERLSEDQRVAVQASLDHKFCMILGPGGTGKSTVIGEIVRNLDTRNLKYLLTSFTGKAVGRIQEITKKKAFTMHRLIYDGHKYKKNEQYDYVIIDEISMVTTQLFCEFIKCYPNINQYVFLGDNNQLQPIDAGSFLNELLKSSVVPTYYLTTNHRIMQNENDGILLNANMIINHDPEFPFEFEQRDNFQIVNGEMDAVFEIIQGCYDAGIDVEDIMVISPYKDYVRDLNLGIKNIYNRGKPTVVDSRGTKWSVGDRVMLLKNIGSILFNGQQGRITSVNDVQITVDFGDAGVHNFKLNSKMRMVKGTVKDEDMLVTKLQHSYANTLHKNQGQEASIVIGYFPSTVKGSGFLNKSLLYTLITRARELVYLIVPNVNILIEAVGRKPSFRYENLNQRLKVLPQIQPFKLAKKVLPKITTKELISTDPDLEGMEEEYYDD